MEYKIPAHIGKESATTIKADLVSDLLLTEKMTADAVLAAVIARDDALIAKNAALAVDNAVKQANATASGAKADAIVAFDTANLAKNAADAALLASRADPVLSATIEQADANNMLKTGFYALGALAANRPPAVTEPVAGVPTDVTSSAWFHVQVIAHSNGLDVLQIATDYKNVATWQRQMGTAGPLTGWSNPWKRMDAQSPAPAPIYSNVPLNMPPGISGSVFFRRIDDKTVILGGNINRTTQSPTVDMLFITPGLTISAPAGIELSCLAETRFGNRVSAILRYNLNGAWLLDAAPIDLPLINKIWLDGIIFSTQ